MHLIHRYNLLELPKIEFDKDHYLELSIVEYHW